MSVVNDEYWSHWSPAAHERYQWIVDTIDYVERRVLPGCPIPDWLRAEIDGVLTHSDTPTLSWARITAPVDWPALVREHSDDLPVGGAIGRYDPGWDRITQAVDYLRGRGHTVALDVDLDVEVDGDLALWHSGLSIDALATDDECATVAELLDLDCEVFWPSTRLATVTLSDRSRRVMYPSRPAQVDRVRTDWLWCTLAP